MPARPQVLRRCAAFSASDVWSPATATVRMSATGASAAASTSAPSRHDRDAPLLQRVLRERRDVPAGDKRRSSLPYSSTRASASVTM